MVKCARTAEGLPLHRGKSTAARCRLRRDPSRRGAEGTRTPDPLHAMEVRYQLRYSPELREAEAYPMRGYPFGLPVVGQHRLRKRTRVVFGKSPSRAEGGNILTQDRP